MNGNQKSIDWEFWRRWVLFNTVGYGMGGVAGFIGGFIAGFSIVGLIAQCFYSLGLLIPGTYMDPGTVMVAVGTAMVLGGAIAGALIGLALWQALRLKTPGVRQATWMKVHIVGMAISWIVFISIVSIDPEQYMAFALFIPILFWALLSAAVQWQALKGQIQHTPLWFTLYILFGGLVVIVSLIITRFLTNLYPLDSQRDEFTPLLDLIPPITLWPLAGLLFGLMTGTLLTWLLRGSNQPDESSEYALVK